MVLPLRFAAVKTDNFSRGRIPASCPIHESQKADEL
jgi:hypothetical protein